MTSQPLCTPDSQPLAHSTSHVMSLIDTKLTPHPAFSIPQSQTQSTSRPQRNARLFAYVASSQSSAIPQPSQSSVISAPLLQPLAPTLIAALPCPPQADHRKPKPPPHFAQVRKKERVPISITSGKIVTSSYVG